MFGPAWKHNVATALQLFWMRGLMQKVEPVEGFYLLHFIGQPTRSWSVSGTSVSGTLEVPASDLALGR